MCNRSPALSGDVRIADQLPITCASCPRGEAAPLTTPDLSSSCTAMTGPPHQTPAGFTLWRRVPIGKRLPGTIGDDGIQPPLHVAATMLPALSTGIRSRAEGDKRTGG
jgi:hypothetical protein